MGETRDNERTGEPAGRGETLYASFSSSDLAERAAGALLDHGLRGEDITLVANEAYGHSWLEKRRTPVTEESADDREVTDDAAGDPVEEAKHGISTTTPADAASGALTGAGIGLGLGAVAALASLFIPGVGLVLGGGALAEALGAAGTATLAGAVAGGVTGYLKDQGMPDEVTESYQASLAGGGAIIAVRVPSASLSRERVEEILAKYDVIHVYVGPDG
jgi:hypothetical protein